MAPALSGKRVLQLVGAIVVYHELACDKGQLISEEVDRDREKYPVLVSLFIVVTAAHLLRRLPTKADPYAWAGVSFDKLKGNT